MKIFNRSSSPNGVVLAMATLLVISAIFVSKGYHKGVSWFIIPANPLPWTDIKTPSYMVLNLFRLDIGLVIINVFSLLSIGLISLSFFLFLFLFFLLCNIIFLCTDFPFSDLFCDIHLLLLFLEESRKAEEITKYGKGFR